MALQAYSNTSQLPAGKELDTDGEDDIQPLSNDKRIPPRRLVSPDYVMTDVSPVSRTPDGAILPQYQTTSHAEQANVKSPKKAVNSLPKMRPEWPKMRLHREQATEKVDAVRKDIECCHQTIHIMAPTKKLGLRVGRLSAGGPIYVRRLDPLSPMRGQLRLNDRIIAINDEDVQQMSPIKIGELLCRTTTTVRKISIVRKINNDLE